MLSAAGALLHGAAPPPPSSPRLLLPGSVFELPRDILTSAWAVQAALLLASVPALDHLAEALPRCFTPGEAGILLQALLVLAAGSGAYLAGSVRQGAAHLLWSPRVAQPDPGMHVPAFCMLVLFWVLLLAGCCTVAVGGRRPGAAGRQEAEIEGEEAESQGDGDTANGAVVMAAANGRGHGATATENLRQRQCGKAGAPSAAPGGTALASVVKVPSRGRSTSGLTGTAGRIAAGLGAVVSFLALVDLALWLLRRFIAASSRPRLATLAYWFGCLAVTVPLMYVVSKASAAREAAREREGGAQAEVDQKVGAQERKSSGRGELGKRGMHEQDGTQLSAQQPHGAWQGREGTAHRRRHLAVNGGASHDASNAEDEVPDTDSAAAAPSALTQRRRASLASSPLLRALAIPHIVMRKGYHLLAILLFLPAFGWDVRMLQASLAVAGAVLVCTELLRCAGPPGVRRAIGGFMADFADARDSGPVYVTHFTLLLGIAVPVWLAESVCGAAAGAMMAGLYGSEAAAPMAAPPGSIGPPLSAAAARLLPSCRAVVGLSGLVSLGSGDTAAACVGFLLGRLRLFRGGKKTWEGTLSGAAAMLGSWAVVVWWMDVRWALGWGTWGALAAVTCGVSLLEAVTAQLDNVVVPLYYLTHLVLVMTGN